jgi:hypothetical protein
MQRFTTPLRHPAIRISRTGITGAFGTTWSRLSGRNKSDFEARASYGLGTEISSQDT